MSDQVIYRITNRELLDALREKIESLKAWQHFYEGRGDSDQAMVTQATITGLELIRGTRASGAHESALRRKLERDFAQLDRTEMDEVMSGIRDGAWSLSEKERYHWNVRKRNDRVIVGPSGRSQRGKPLRHR